MSGDDIRTYARREHDHSESYEEAPAVAHADTTGKTADDHHDQDHDHSSSSDGVDLIPETIEVTGGNAASGYQGVLPLVVQCTTTVPIVGLKAADNADGAGMLLASVRGTPAVPTKSLDGDVLGVYGFAGNDDDNNVYVPAFIGAEIDGSPGTQVIPTGLHFWTDGGSGVAERVAITKDGFLIPKSSGLKLGQSGDEWAEVHTDALTVDGEDLTPGSGTYIPTFDFLTTGDLSVVYSVQEGWYFKIGKQVWVTLNVTCVPTYTTASGAAQFSLPSTVASNGANYRPTGACVAAGWTLSGVSALAFLPQYSGAYGRIRYSRSGLNDLNMTTSQFPTGSSVELWAQVLYEEA